MPNFRVHYLTTPSVTTSSLLFQHNIEDEALRKTNASISALQHRAQAVRSVS